MPNSGMNPITQFALSQIERLETVVREQNEIRQRFQQLTDEGIMLRHKLEGAKATLKHASEASFIAPEEFQVVQNALIRLEAAETGIPLPEDHPALRDPAKPRTLLEVLDQITAPIDHDFRAEEARKLLAPYVSLLKREPHPASVAGALRDLVKAGKLRLVSGGGRGNEATYRRVEESGRLVPEGDDNEA